MTHSSNDYSTTVTIGRSPADVYAAILDARAWWNVAIDGPTTAAGDEFGFEVEGLHRVRMRVTRLIPGALVEWVVVDDHFGFVEDQSEWVGDRMVFELETPTAARDSRSPSTGLPELECYDVCWNAWRSSSGTTWPARPAPHGRPGARRRQP